MFVKYGLCEKPRAAMARGSKTHLLEKISCPSTKPKSETLAPPVSWKTDKKQRSVAGTLAATDLWPHGFTMIKVPP